MNFLSDNNFDKIHVLLKDNPYYIYIGSGILTEIPVFLKDSYNYPHYVIVTDDIVRHLLGEDLKKILDESGVNADIINFSNGETSKNLQTVETLARDMVRLRADRKSCIIALGGGVVGDVAGFLASIYMRGIPFIQIPTTLLAQVDSSVGGKTGVDIPEGKNLIGTFYQPKAVFIDIGVLGTLPVSQIKNGIAEVVKYGVIKSPELFELLENYSEQIFNLNPDIITRIVKKSCEIKADIVIKDEKEGDLRRILNFGHTLGHAIESLSNYDIQHGEAISIGMSLIGKISEKMGKTNPQLSEKLSNLINKLGLTTLIPSNINTNDIINSIKSDKKSQSGKIFFILMQAIGEVFISDMVPENLIIEAIEELRG